MKRVFVENGEVKRVEDLGKRLMESKEALRRAKISKTLKARNKELREYKDKVCKLKSVWGGRVK